MKNRIPDLLSPSTRNGHPSQPAFEELRNLAQRQFADRMRQIESYVQQHPATAVGAGICIGIILGWVIKRR